MKIFLSDETNTDRRSGRPQISIADTLQYGLSLSPGVEPYDGLLAVSTSRELVALQIFPCLDWFWFNQFWGAGNIKEEKQRKGGRLLLRQDPPLDLSFWSFSTFLHHGIEEVEKQLL